MFGSWNGWYFLLNFFFRQRYISYSLRTADAFPIVASLPPKNNLFLIWRERSDDRKCVCSVRRLHFIASDRLNTSHLIYYFLFTVESVIKWSLVPWRSPFRHILAPSERFFPFLVKDSCRGFIEKGTHFLWISPTVQHSNKTGNSYFNSLFVDNDLTYPKVWMGGGGRRVGGGVERKVIIRRDYRGELLEDVLLRKKRFCKYHVIENVCNNEKRLKTKVRKVWIKRHTSHEPNM